MSRMEWEYDLVERPFCQQLERMGWQWIEADPDLPETSERTSSREVLLKGRLATALRKLNLRDGSPWLDDARIARAIRDLEQAAGHQLMEINQSATELLLKGTTADGLPDWEVGRPQPVKFIDFENWRNNDFVVINQFKVELTSGRGRRSRRRSTIAVTVDRDGDLLIHSPLTSEPAELRSCIKRKLLWVHRKLALKAGVMAAGRPPEFVTGESFSFLGRTYRLRLVDEQNEPLHFDGDTFRLRRDARPEAQEHFRRWYRAQGLPWLKQRIGGLSRRVGARPSEVKVRDLAYRWGSCNGQGRVCFHWKVFQLPVRLVDYVVVHELAHLVEPHHGPAFWACVERALPDWRDRRQELAYRATEFLGVDGERTKRARAARHA